nr:Chain P, Surface protein gp120 [Human immunodeficiency virus type 1 (BRU ISOLATE)]
RGPGCA